MLNFDHAVTAVRAGNGNYRILDATDETAAFGLPEYLADKSYLVATPEGEILRTTAVAPVEENRVVIDTAARLTDSGD